MFSRSFTEAGDTIAAPEFDPGDLGAQSLPTTTKTNCTATVENEKVNIDNFFMGVYVTMRMKYLCTYLFLCFLVCSASY